jgi:outer membrane protein assembly factor BamB
MKVKKVMKKIVLLILIAMFVILTGCMTNDKTPVTVHITSIPSNASVYFDETYKGTTPIDIEGIAKGKHKVLVVKAGCVAEKSNIKVEKSALFNFSLKEVPTIVNEKCGDVYGSIIYQNKLYTVETYDRPHRIYVRCIDLNKKQESWKYEITHTLLSSVKDFKLINGNVYVSVDEETNSCYKNRNNCYFVYVINEDGQLINKYTLDWISQGEIGKKGIVVDYDFDFFNRTYDNLIGGYSLNEHKYLWKKHIKGNPVIGKDLGGNDYYLFQVADSYLRIIKIDKQTGTFITDRTFPEMGNFPEDETTGASFAKPFAVIGHKAFFTPDEEHIYCVDLDSMKIINSLDTGIYFSGNNIKSVGGLLFVPGEGKTLVIDLNSGKIIKTLNKEFDEIAVSNERIYIAVNGDRIYCFDRRGKEIPFPYSPKMLGGSFESMEIKNNILIATAVNRITGEAVDYIYAFDTKTNEPLFALKNAKLLSFTDSTLVVTTFDDSFSHKNARLAVIDLSKLQR